MEKFLESLSSAKKKIGLADHLTYMTFPLVQEKRLLLKIIRELKQGVAECINAILQQEYLYKRISLKKDPQANLRVFLEKCAKRYNLTEREKSLILQLFEVFEEHTKSPMEFVKGNKIVILSENLGKKIITIEKIKEFLEVSKQLVKKAEAVFLRKI
jgi:hypothetical protein